MPKVNKKDSNALLQEVQAVPMDAENLIEDPVQPDKPQFAPLSAYEQNGKKIEFRRVTVPQHRMTPLKNSWMNLYTPVTENMKLDMRMNLKAKKVELKTNADTPDTGSLQKAADFVQAFILGFDIADAIALLRLDDLYVEVFEVKDVKTLRGEHLSRCIGRLAGKSMCHRSPTDNITWPMLLGFNSLTVPFKPEHMLQMTMDPTYCVRLQNGKTKFTIENATKTRIVIADTHIHILGSYQNIRVARDALCGLILGSPPGKVYSKLRSVCSRLNSRY